MQIRNIVKQKDAEKEQNQCSTGYVNTQFMIPFEVCTMTSDDFKEGRLSSIDDDTSEGEYETNWI